LRCLFQDSKIANHIIPGEISLTEGWNRDDLEIKQKKKVEMNVNENKLNLSTNRKIEQNSPNK
jgi:hypothetical protein